MAVASSVVSPLCTWIVAAGMSVASEKTHIFKSPHNLQFSKRLSRRKLVVQSSNYGGGLMSSLCGSVNHCLMNFGPSFEPCPEGYNSVGISFSLALFGENEFSVFGYKAVPGTRKHRKSSKAAASANESYFLLDIYTIDIVHEINN